MAGVIQAGDLVKLAELAWRVYDYGWNPELNATTQYWAFGEDLKGLASTLNLLREVIARAEQSIENCRGDVVDALVFDRQSFFEIVGDAERTFLECEQLIKKNKRHAEDAGATRSIEWNVFIQPQVERLRGRILLHNSRLSHALKPLEIDLLVRGKDEVLHRLDAVDQRVGRVQSDVRALIESEFPALAQELREREEREVRTVEIPEHARNQFELHFRNYDTRDTYPPLHHIADIFITNLHRSTRTFQPGHVLSQRYPSPQEYMSLLRCQFLMEKMKTHSELRDGHEMSHWPRYLENLEDELSEECRRFKTRMLEPRMTHYPADYVRIWPEKRKEKLLDPIIKPVLVDELLKAPLVSQNDQSRVERSLILMRHSNSGDKKFRLLLLATGSDGRTEKIAVDFDTTKDSLRPYYVFPGDGRNAPYELILDTNNREYLLVFRRLSDLLKFQQAVTGYSVAENYVESTTTVSFVTPGNAKPILEDASIQLWIPRRLVGSPAPDISDTSSVFDGIESDTAVESMRRMSIGSSMSHDSGLSFSTGSPPSSPRYGRPGLNTVREESFEENPNGHSRQPRMPNDGGIRSFAASPTPWGRHSRNSSSMSSSSSLNGFATADSIDSMMGQPAGSRASVVSNGSQTSQNRVSRPPSISSFRSGSGSRSSSTSDHTIPVSLGSGNKQGFLIKKPQSPMLILFCRNRMTKVKSIVMMRIDEDTKVNFQKCGCQNEPEKCKIVAIEQQAGAASLNIRKLGGAGGYGWDLMSITKQIGLEQTIGKLNEWPGVIRVSILFRDPKARQKFGGCYCKCKIKKEKHMIACIDNGHYGLFGQVVILYSQQMKSWFESRHGNTNEVVRVPAGRQDFPLEPSRPPSRR